MKTTQDFNWYRKVSKYDIDANQVDWNDLMKEKDRQNRINISKRKEEGGAATTKKKQDEVINKMVKINQLN
jgi:uncharacterized lipoprotein YddW (UPF0748 family)